MAAPTAPARWSRRSLQSRQEGNQGAGLATQSLQLDAELGDPVLAVDGQLQEFAVTSDQPALMHPLEQSDPQLAGEMVVADPRLPKPLVWRAEAGGSTHRDHPH
jgi:hypothetical protein